MIVQGKPAQRLYVYVALKLTRVFVGVHVVEIAGLLTQDHAVEAFVYEAVVVLDELPDQLRRHGGSSVFITLADNAVAAQRVDYPPGHSYAFEEIILRNCDSGCDSSCPPVRRLRPAQLRTFRATFLHSSKQS